VSEAFVVMTDIHANAPALRAALEIARRGPMDRLLVLGDLLTYGLDVNETLDLVEEAQERDGAVLLLGNHDQLYLDMEAGRLDYYLGLPDWLRESVEYTMRLFDVRRLASRLHWLEETILGDVLFAHANPYPFGDWSYVDTDVDAARAAIALGHRGLVAGVFGHTHRRRLYVETEDGTSRSLEPRATSTVSTDGARLVVNPGSIGQPRDGSPRSSMVRLVRGPGFLRSEFVDVDYDVAALVERLQTAPLSLATRERLASFFLPR
jgi:predicted phosphodiesterase